MSKDHNEDNDRTKTVTGRDEGQDRPRISRLGHFRIESVLGSGGMGTIYRAYDESMKRPVALKVLHSSLEISSQAQSRFVREAWIAGQLDHPNIVKVHSRGEENKVSYLAMELAEGGSLSDFIKRTRESIPSGSDVTGTVDRDYIDNILRKFIELASALEHIHAKGFIHRDIKPHNILLAGPQKKCKLTDFGIAHAADMTRMTKAGDFIGTVKYMSPELLAAHRAGVDKRTDIYSLGVTLYEALTLSLPYVTDSEEKLIGEILAGHHIEARKANRRVPVDLETVLMKACHHDPGLRYQTASAFADDLQRVIDGRPILAKRQSTLSRTVKYVRRNYRTVTAVVAAALIIAVTILWSLSRMVQPGGPDADRPRFTEISIPTYPGNGVLSPDGEQLAFASGGIVWTVPLHGKVDPKLAGNPVQLTEKMGAWNWGDINHMAWSGDGKLIAFNTSVVDSNAAEYTNKVYVVPSTGGKSREILSGLYRGNWIINDRLSLTPDGSQLVYSSADEPFLESHTGPPLSPLFIQMVSIDDGSKKQLTTVPSREAATSPDGTRIAFIAAGSPRQSVDTTVRRYEREGLAVYVIDTSGGQPALVVDLPGWESYPVWSPDSRMIAFSYTSEEGHQDIRIVPVSDDPSPESTAIAVEPPTQRFQLAGWSTRDQLGVCAFDADHVALFTVPSSGGQAVQIAPEGSIQHPRWTPDGQRIYYYTENREIAFVPADGGAPEIIPRFSDNDEQRLYPHYYGSGNAVSPDGSTLVFAGTRKGHEGAHIWTMSLDGKRVKQITACPDSFEDSYPCWSPRGDSIAFIRTSLPDDQSIEGRRDVFIASVNGGQPRKVTANEDSVAWSVIAWSPDGRNLAYRSYTGRWPKSRAFIKTIPVSGGKSRVITEVHAAYVTTSLDWSPDGKKIVYDYDSKSIQIISLEDSTITEVKTGLDKVLPYYVSWSPDGEKIAFSGYRKGEKSFYLIENFLPED